jgi:hypothetical protein
MTAAEKAQDLIVKFFILPEENEGVGRLKGKERRLLAKQCALIAVDEIIKSGPYYFYPGRKVRSVEEHSTIEYWQQVKSELEKH